MKRAAWSSEQASSVTATAAGPRRLAKVPDPEVSTDPDLRQGVRTAGPLVGTHAHEVMSITAQLMGRYDDEAGDERGPAPIAALLAHLLYLRRGLRRSL